MVLHHIVLAIFFYVAPRTQAVREVTLKSTFMWCFSEEGSMRILYLLVMGNILSSVCTLAFFHRKPRTLEIVAKRENIDFIILMAFFALVDITTRF